MLASIGTDVSCASNASNTSKPSITSNASNPSSKSNASNSRNSCTALFIQGGFLYHNILRLMPFARRPFNLLLHTWLARDKASYFESIGGNCYLEPGVPGFDTILLNHFLRGLEISFNVFRIIFQYCIISI